MKSACWIVAAILACCNLSTSQAAGILKISKSELRQIYGRYEKLTLKNCGDMPLYIIVNQQLLINPGMTPEQLVPIGEVEKPSLLVGPPKLILRPGQEYEMSVRTLGVPTNPRVWRVTFRTADKVRFGKKSDKDYYSPIIVSVGYGVVFYQDGKLNGKS